MIKWLKLCMLGLIGGLALSVNFSSAWNNVHQVGIGENLGQNNYCIIDSNLSFQCSLSDNVLISQSEDRSIAYFWLNNGLGIYQMRNDNFRFYGQGIMTGFQFCTYDFSNVSDLSNVFGEGFYWSNCLGKVYSFEEFKEYISSHELQGRGFLSNAGDFGFGGPVFIFDNGAFRATADSLDGDLKVYYGTYYTHDFGLTGMALSADFSNINVRPVPGYVSPFNPPSQLPDYDFEEEGSYTNLQIIQGYNAMGLTDEFCYGGFPINDIFESGQVPSEFVGYQWGSGAFILDIWDNYKTAYNDDYLTFLGNFYIAYSSDSYSSFYGYPKALYGFINQWFSVSSKGLGFLEATAPQFTLVDIWEYCDIKFNKNLSDTYTGNRWDPKWAYYRSGQVNLGGYFNFSGNNSYFSGTYSGFDNVNDFFGSMNAIFQGNLGTIGYKEPLLPAYILVFLFALILVRMLSH